MNEEIVKAIKEAVAVGIQLNVNGKLDKLDKKIDAHNSKHEQDMERILPIIEAYETSERAVETAKTGGKIVLWLAGFITAVGGAYLIIRQIFFN